MHSKYPHIFSPIKIGPVEIPNRFYNSPHASPSTTLRGGPTDDFIAYYEARAKGGVGLVMLSLSVPERGRNVQPSAHARETIPLFRAQADAVHKAGGKIFGELWYFWGSPGPWAAFSPLGPALSASAVQLNLHERRVATREMSQGEIRLMIDACREASSNLREAGFDGVMLHAAHATMPEQFMSPYFNRRTDEYGGSFENRMRFLYESLQAMREGGGSKMAVGMRINCDELLEGGYDTKGAYQILKATSESGLIDFVDLDVGVEPDQFYIGMPSVFIEPHPYRPYVEAIRSAAGKIPVLSVLGRLTSIADGEAVLAAGVCDMVGAARALIAEPELVKNAFEGNEDRSRTCIACNWCMAAPVEGAQSCTINPASWRERHWGTFTPSPRSSKVIIVGAGPAGLEAARVSALRGHSVTLLEKSDKCGGALALWSKLPGREFYQNAVDWWEREIRRLDINIYLGVEATAEGILKEKPDAVILATGARYSKAGHSNHRDADIPGYDQAFVYRPEEILRGKAKPSGNIVVFDGEGMHTGVGIAEALGMSGSHVQYVTPYFSPVSPRVQAGVEVTPLMKRLRKAGVKFSMTSFVKSIGDHEVTICDVYSEHEHTMRGIDAVILSTGRVAVNELEKELDGKVPQLFPVGDALAPRIWAAASYEGHKFARYIGEPGAPKTVGDVYFSTDEKMLFGLS